MKLVLSIVWFCLFVFEIINLCRNSIQCSMFLWLLIYFLKAIVWTRVSLYKSLTGFLDFCMCLCNSATSVCGLTVYVHGNVIRVFSLNCFECRQFGYCWSAVEADPWSRLDPNTPLFHLDARVGRWRSGGREDKADAKTATTRLDPEQGSRPTDHQLYHWLERRKGDRSTGGWSCSRSGKGGLFTFVWQCTAF